jgi:transposase
MVTQCPEYKKVQPHVAKAVVNLPIIPEEIPEEPPIGHVVGKDVNVCPFIDSVDKNLISEFGREYRARFCFDDFEKCEYRKLLESKKKK